LLGVELINGLELEFSEEAATEAADVLLLLMLLLLSDGAVDDCSGLLVSSFARTAVGFTG